MSSPAKICESHRRRPCVLVVEPDPDVLQLFGRTLEELGATMIAAHATAAAGAVLATAPVDFAYIALAPRDEGNGMALAATAVARGIPVAVMSGHPQGVASALA